MRYVFTTTLLLLFLCQQAQTITDVEAELKTINAKVVGTGCRSGEGLLISNRAMNFLLSDKAGSYLSQFNDLSFYKNNITFDAGDGTFSLNHNMFQASGKDTAVRSFLVFGARANVTNAFAAAFAAEPFQNRLGVTIKQTWLGNPKTYFDCIQKQQLDAERAVLLQSLLADLNRQATEFEKNITGIKQEDVPGQNLQQVKDSLRRMFAANMRDEYNQRFALAQSRMLISRNAYKKISLSWTSISVYLPVIRQQFFVATSLAGNIERKYSYPVELAIYHSRLIELGAKGRFFLTVAGTLLQNNAAQSSLLFKTGITDYQRLGGTDTLRLAELGRNSIYRGGYRNFFTPSLKGQVVYFPPDSHIGFSGQLEQNFGEYNALNGIIGIPIVLIDKETSPAATFHFQVKYFDIGNKILPAVSWKDKLSIGMTLGVPFSKIIY